MMIKIKNLLTKTIHFNLGILILLALLLVSSIGSNVWLWWENHSVQEYLDNNTYQSSLNNLLEENTILLINAIKSSNIDKNDYTASTKALDTNTLQVAVWIGNIYGMQSQNNFQLLWKNQTYSYLQYALYSEKDDSTDSVKYLSEITKFPNKMTEFLTQLNPKASQDILKQLLNSYVAVTKTIIDTHLVKDPTTFYIQQHDALVLMNEIAETITKDATVQYPNKIK